MSVYQLINDKNCSIILSGIPPKRHKTFANTNFRQTSTVFRDPAQLNLYDEEHSQEEDRWITIGLDETSSLRVIVHTFEQIDKDRCLIRIISARKATLAEQAHYQRRKP